MQDVKLIWLWEKWKQSIADELACDAVAADRAHARTQAIEREIAETRAEGLVGIGIQFGLWRFINGHFILGSDQADAAYEALVRLTGKDCTAEARSAPGWQTSGNWALFPPVRIECRLRIIPDPGKPLD